MHLSHAGLVFTMHVETSKFAQFQRLPCTTIDERQRLIDLTCMWHAGHSPVQC